ncbi:hypothetical protein [Spartinivicinus ruber]|uniref:hypothetical protein n=1 Tax=Spartinivicinus ruber TaxID=2683272 RepID=UPI0013D0B434|nr:hypothetical protein [Spartinivicinus ruber]
MHFPPTKSQLLKRKPSLLRIFILISCAFTNITSFSCFAQPALEYTFNSAKEQENKAPTNDKLPKKPKITLQLDNSPIDINEPYSLKIESEQANRIENNLKEPGLKVNITIWFD